MENWLPISEFCKIIGASEEEAIKLINEKQLLKKVENNIIYVDASNATTSLSKSFSVVSSENNELVSASFVEKTVGTILTLHEKIISSKDETISTLKDENNFLRESVIKMQEVYDSDKDTIKMLSEQLKKTTEETEALKRKYKLLWGKKTED